MTDSAERASRNGQRLVAFYDQPPTKPHDVRGVDLLPISEAHNYTMQGPAVVKLVYITHPSKERTLVPFADYDEQLVLDKLNEALRVVNCLGASHVVAKSVKGSSTTARGGVSGRFVSAGGEKATHWDVAYEQKGKGGRAMDPRPLAYPDEPGFEAACVAVLSNGASSVKIEIIRQSQFSVDGELAVSLKKAGFQLGVAAEKTRYSVFLIEAAFGPVIAPSEPPLAASKAPEPPPTGWRRSRS